MSHRGCPPPDGTAAAAPACCCGVACESAREARVTRFSCSRFWYLQRAGGKEKRGQWVPPFGVGRTLENAAVRQVQTATHAAPAKNSRAALIQLADVLVLHQGRNQLGILLQHLSRSQWSESWRSGIASGDTQFAWQVCSGLCLCTLTPAGCPPSSALAQGRQAAVRQTYLF